MNKDFCGPVTNPLRPSDVKVSLRGKIVNTVDRSKNWTSKSENPKENVNPMNCTVIRITSKYL